MAFYTIETDTLRPIDAITFTAAKLSERYDMQRLLRDRIEVVAPDTLVIAEELCDWQDSFRRIDLLGIDRDANLVVIELKVTEDGGHMELQALRYAAMVSPMTFDHAVQAFEAYLVERKLKLDARQTILDFLHWNGPEDGRLGENVRIVLVSPDFSREITTTVLWLRDRGLDINCVRFRPYSLDGRLLADVQQVIPLPEAEEYQVQLRRKTIQERADRATRPTIDEMWERVSAGLTPEEIAAARDIHDRVAALGTEWFANQASLAQLYSAGGHNFYFFNFRPGGQVEISFKWLSSYAPFAEEAKRRELLDKLNALAGVTIPPDKLGGAPKLPIAALVTPGNRAAFCEIWSWATGEIDATYDGNAAG